MGTRGFQEEARLTATELVRCRQERSRKMGISWDEVKRLRRTGGAGRIVSPNVSLMRDEPGTRKVMLSQITVAGSLNKSYSS